MEQVAGVFRARYNRQAKVIRVQWFAILALLLALILSLTLRPFAQRDVVSLAPTPALQQAASTPKVETASPEPTPILTSLGEFKLTAYCANCVFHRFRPLPRATSRQKANPIPPGRFCVP